jgi:hypothetical protein
MKLTRKDINKYNYYILITINIIIYIKQHI